MIAIIRAPRSSILKKPNRGDGGYVFLTILPVFKKTWAFFGFLNAYRSREYKVQGGGVLGFLAHHFIARYFPINKTIDDSKGQLFQGIISFTIYFVMYFRQVGILPLLLLYNA